jgi:hypothetical protein
MERKLFQLGFCFVAFAMGAAAQTVTGSGTSGTVPVFNGTSSVTNSPISVSGSNVGIGTSNPSTLVQLGSPGNGGTNKLSIPGAYNFENIYLGQTGNGSGALEFLNHSSVSNSYGAKLFTNIDTGVYGLQFAVAPGAASYGALAYTTAMTIVAGGNVGIGTTAPGARLEVNGSVKLTANSGASITFQDGTTQTTAYTGVLCGGDYAESVDVTGDRDKYQPGDLLVIDPDVSGKFLKSAEPYSTAVTGIYSTKPGTVGRRQTTPKSEDEVPMAMIGIVPTKVSTENGPIHRGDLLVSSSSIGYAMKGTDRGRLTGAVIGKALDNLESGQGVIEVVVTLQ